MFAIVDRIDSGDMKIWVLEVDYPDGVPLNKTTTFEGSSLCLTLYMRLAISCSRMLYKNKLARISKSSYARFQSQKTALSPLSFTCSNFFWTNLFFSKRIILVVNPILIVFRPNSNSYPFHTRKTCFVKLVFTEWKSNWESKNFIFHRIQVLANLHFQCATFKPNNFRLSSFYEEKKLNCV